MTQCDRGILSARSTGHTDVYAGLLRFEQLLKTIPTRSNTLMASDKVYTKSPDPCLPRIWAALGGTPLSSPLKPPYPGTHLGRPHSAFFSTNTYSYTLVTVERLCIRTLHYGLEPPQTK